MKKNFTINNFVIASIVALFLSGCAASTKVTISSDKYAPAFRSGDVSRLKGKKLILSPFLNQAQNTKGWNYYSADKKYMYEGNAQLETYYWNCFHRAFKYSGVNLVDYSYADYRGPHPYWWGGPPTQAKPPQAKGVLEFQLILTSLTDQEFKFKAFLFKDGLTKFEKEFTVTMAAAQSENAADLEKRAYRLVYLAFTTIIKDRDFQKAF
jgi:hypothetical protein